MGQEWDAQGKPIQAAPQTSAPTEWDANGKPIATTPPAQAQPEQRGFFQSLADSTGVTGAYHAIKDEANSILDHPVAAATDWMSGGPAQRAVGGIVQMGKDSASQVQQAYQAAKAHSGAGVVQHAVTAIPIVGPALDRASDQYADKNYGGEAGTLLGTAASVAPMALGAADAAVPGRAVIPNPAPLQTGINAMRTAVANIPQAAGRVALMGKTPEGAYESAMKPSTALSPEQRSAIVQTGLEQGIPVSKSGVEKIGDLIDDLNSKIKAQIANDPTRPIDPNAVATRADAAKAKFTNQVNAQPDLNAIEASRQQFLTEQGAKPPVPAVAPRPTGVLDAQGNPIMTQGSAASPPAPAPAMDAADAQTMKQGTYQVLRGKYGEQGSASVEAQKALARGLKEEIATQFPEISNLNAAEGRLLDLQPVLERAVNRISNHQAIGIGTPIAGAATKAVTGSSSVGGVAMTLKAVLDNPAVKSRLAIAVSKASKVPYSQALARVNTYGASLGSAALASQANSPDDTQDQPATPQP